MGVANHGELSEGRDDLLGTVLRCSDGKSVKEGDRYARHGASSSGAGARVIFKAFMVDQPVVVAQNDRLAVYVIGFVLR